jgi:peptidyl-prolyl cis-trans isomerase B (cyclophilin B)
MSKAILETNFGRIVFELLPNLAPETVRNFAKLAQSSFYDGTLFHRVIPGFMIQGSQHKGSRQEQVGHGWPRLYNKS